MKLFFPSLLRHSFQITHACGLGFCLPSKERDSLWEKTKGVERPSSHLFLSAAVEPKAPKRGISPSAAVTLASESLRLLWLPSPELYI